MRVEVYRRKATEKFDKIPVTHTQGLHWIKAVTAASRWIEQDSGVRLKHHQTELVMYAADEARRTGQGSTDFGIASSQRVESYVTVFNREVGDD